MTQTGRHEKYFCAHLKQLALFLLARQTLQRLIKNTTSSSPLNLRGNRQISHRPRKWSAKKEKKSHLELLTAGEPVKTSCKTEKPSKRQVGGACENHNRSTWVRTKHSLYLMQDSACPVLQKGVCNKMNFVYLMTHYSRCSCCDPLHSKDKSGWNVAHEQKFRELKRSPGFQRVFVRTNTS